MRSLTKLIFPSLLIIVGVLNTIGNQSNAISCSGSMTCPAAIQNTYCGIGPSNTIVTPVTSGCSLSGTTATCNSSGCSCTFSTSNCSSLIANAKKAALVAYIATGATRNGATGLSQTFTSTTKATGASQLVALGGQMVYTPKMTAYNSNGNYVVNCTAQSTDFGVTFNNGTPTIPVAGTYVATFYAPETMNNGYQWQTTSVYVKSNTNSAINAKASFQNLPGGGSFGTGGGCYSAGSDLVGSQGCGGDVGIWTLPDHNGLAAGVLTTQVFSANAGDTLKVTIQCGGGNGEAHVLAGFAYMVLTHLN